MIKIDIKKSIVIDSIDIPSISRQQEGLDVEAIESLISNLNVSTPLMSLTRGVTSRILRLVPMHPEDEEIANEIQMRGAKTENFNDFLNKLALAPFFGYVVHEKIYNEDFSVKRLEFVPFKCLKYDKEKGLLLKTKNGEMPITEDKFLVSVFDKTLDRPLGKSLFDYGLKEVYDDLVDVENKVRGLQRKYGNIVKVFGYHAEELEGKTPDQIFEYLKEKAEKYNNMLGKTDAMAAPINPTVPLANQIHFISLADLKIDMHKTLMNRYENKIEKFIKGSIYSESTAGSQAKDRVQQDEKEKIEDHIAKFMSSELKKLLVADALFFGYQPECFSFVFELDQGELATEEVMQARERTKKEKLGVFRELMSLGYKVKAEKIAEAAGLKVTDMEEVDIPIVEFSKDKKKDYLEARKQFKRDLDNKFQNVFENKWGALATIINESCKKAFKSFDITNPTIVSIDMEEMEKFSLLSILNGYYNATLKPIYEFNVENEIDPFELPFEEAINYFLNKVPVLYDHIEYITEMNKTNFFWLKKSTELEVTNRIMKSLSTTLENGQTFKEWYSKLDNELITLGLGDNGYYANLVFRNNMTTAYNVGNWMQYTDNLENSPYGLYDGIDDDRQSTICKLLDGKVYKLTNPIWSSIYPPNHHFCRSSVISLSAEELEYYGLKLDRVTADVKNLDLGTFNTNPALGYAKTLEKGYKKKEKVFNQQSEQLKLL